MAIFKLLASIQKKILYILGKCCPCIRTVIISKPDEYFLVKAIIGFPIGMLLGIGFYKAVVADRPLNDSLKELLKKILIVMLGVGFAISVQMRCIMMLVVPTFFGKTGRGYIASFAIAFLLSGPLSNLIYNGHEVIQTVGCTIKLAHNISMERWQLTKRPLLNLMKELQKESKHIKNKTAEIRKSFIPLESEVEDMDEVEHLKEDIDYVDRSEHGQSRSLEIEKKYNKRRAKTLDDKTELKYEEKLDFRCEDIYSLGIKHCRKAFEEAESRCFSKVGIAGHVLCLPLKLSLVCNLISLLPGITGANCDSMEAVNQGFGETFHTAQKAAKAFDKNFDVDLKFKIESAQEDLYQNTAQEVGLVLEHEFRRRQAVFESALALFKLAISFMFIRVIISANSYHAKYVSDTKFDNLYITDYFRKIDSRRYSKLRTTLLPLKKFESREFTDPARMKLMPHEKSKLVSGSMKVLVRLFIIATIFLVDRLVFEALSLIRKHSQVTMKQVGTHHISITIQGTGVISQLVRSLINGFNTKHEINQSLSNTECLPNPVSTPVTVLRDVLLVYFFVWLLTLVEAYALRIRRIICAFFYRKREKKRILFLYNDLLKKRKGFLHHMRTEIKNKAKEQTLSIKLTFFQAISVKFPKLGKMLAKLGCGKRNCLVCEEKARKDFVPCSTKGCNFGYCGQCWLDLQRTCYACRPVEDWDSDDEEEEIELE